MLTKFKIAICQMKVSVDKSQNIEKAVKLLEQAAQNNADIAVLPEMFNCPYSNAKFREYSEKAGEGETIRAISKAAKSLGIYIVAGTIPEADNDLIYNTCFAFSREGEIIGRHRKMHLFDVNVPGKLRFMESKVLSPGNEITVIDTEFGKIGIAVCYDMRFPELLRLMTLQGAKLIVIPAAFNMVTGPAHWEPLIRIRAIDNQVYMAAASPARDENSTYVAYGNSMVVEPWGNIIKRAEEKEEIIYADIDLEQVDKVRNELPLLKHRRTDVYDVIEKSI